MVCKIIHAIDRFNIVISNIAMWLIIPLVFVMLYETTARYFFNSPTVWGTELSIMIFGAYIIFSGPYSILEKVQVGVDIFSSRWKPRTRAFINCITYIFTFIFFYQMVRISILYAIESYKLHEISPSAWGQPVYHWKTLIPIAAILILLQTISDFIRNAYMSITGEEIK